MAEMIQEYYFNNVNTLVKTEEEVKKLRKEHSEQLRATGFPDPKEEYTVFFL